MRTHHHSVQPVRRLSPAVPGDTLADARPKRTRLASAKSSKPKLKINPKTKPFKAQTASCMAAGGEGARPHGCGRCTTAEAAVGRCHGS